MKWIVIISFLFSTVFALDPPAPVQGSPSFFGGKHFSSQAGKTIYLFSFPENWGVGECSARQESGDFLLFPCNGGVGCTVHVDQFENEIRANEEVERLKSTFDQIMLIDNGFEASFKNARYACYANMNYVTQIWYSTPRKSKINTELWEKLKQCLSVSEEKSVFEKVEEEEWVAVKEIPWENFTKAWQCEHPDRQFSVALECLPPLSSKVNKNPEFTHLLQMSDYSRDGFFYIQWDQQNLDTSPPYRAHLKEISKDVLKMEKTQQFDREPLFQDGWAILHGYPYTALTVAGDGFLFGFAIKSIGPFGADLRPFVKRVKWWKHNP